MQDKVLVSFASHGREDYRKAQLALIRSTIKKWDGHYMMRCVGGYVDEYLGVPIEKGLPVTEKHGVAWQHKDMPYQFKPFAIQEARDEGYTKVLWCDSTIRLMKLPNWEHAKKYGVCAWDNEGHPLKDCISDYALEQVGLSNADGVKQIMACCIMFDFSNDMAQKILDLWLIGSLNNSFHSSTDSSSNPDYKGNRHDQSYLSALLHLHEIPILPYGELAYPHHTPIKPTYLNYGVPKD
jgi:hypothetical protein